MLPLALQGYFNYPATLWAPAVEKPGDGNRVCVGDSISCGSRGGLQAAGGPPCRPLAALAHGPSGPVRPTNKQSRSGMTMNDAYIFKDGVKVREIERN